MEICNVFFFYLWVNFCRGLNNIPAPLYSAYKTEDCFTYGEVQMMTVTKTIWIWGVGIEKEKLKSSSYTIVKV